MRWERLFADLEARWEEEARSERDAEVADRTRWERGQVSVLDRLAAARSAGRAIAVSTGAGDAIGVVGVVGADWFVLAPRTGGDVLVPLTGVLALTGLPTAAEVGTSVQRRLGLAAALRRIGRDRAPVHVDDVRGATVSGTIDAVGADHLELAVHPADEPRRPASVTALRVVPFLAVARVRRARGQVPGVEDLAAGRQRR